MGRAAIGLRDARGGNPILWMLLAAGFVWSGSAAHADESRYTPVRVWSTNDEPMLQLVTHIVRGPVGYLWLATESGLARFDGHRFKAFDRSNTEEISHNSFVALLVDAEGALWAASGGGGLYRIDENRIERVADLPSAVVWDLAFDDDGTLWVATSQGAARLDGTEMRDTGVASGVCRSIVVDRQGQVWIGTHAGRLIQIGDSPGSHRIHELGSDPIVALAVVDEGALWVGTDHGLLRWSTVEQKVSRSLMSGRAINSLSSGRQGRLWVGTLSNGLWLWHDGHLRRAPLGQGLGTESITAVLEDDDGRLWVGTGAGLVEAVDGPLETLSRLDGLKDEQVWAVAPSSAGGVWIGTGTGGLARYRDGELRHWTADDGLPSERAWALLPKGEELWVGTGGAGVTRLRAGRFETLTTEDGLAANHVWSLFEDRDGAIWMGTDGGGVSRYDGATFLALGTDDGLPSGRVWAVSQDGAGVMWFGTDAGLASWNGHRIEVLGTGEGLRTPYVWCLVFDERHGLWIGLDEGGLALLAGGSVHPVDGLPVGTVYGILPDGDEKLWLNTERGLLSVAVSRDRASGRWSVADALLLGKPDGLRGPLSSGGSPVITRTPDGDVWIATDGGAGRLRAGQRIQPDPPPLVRIEEAASDGGILEGYTGVRLEAGNRFLSILYTAIDFVAPREVRFQVMLEGLEDAWRDVGSERGQRYSRLPPGQYTFRVRAFNRHGIQSPAEARISFRQLPAFYERRSVQLAGAVGLLLVGWVSARSRLRRLSVHNEELRRLIAEREQAEESLKQSERRYRALFENANDMIITFDRSARVLSANRATLTTLGFAPDELLGRQFTELLSPRSRQDWRATLPSPAGPDEDRIYEVEALRRDGTPVQLQAKIRRQPGEEWFQAVVRDATSSKRMEAQLLQSQKMESVGRLAGGVAHDFNNMLHVITGFAELLKRRMPAEEKLSAYVSEIENAAHRARDVTQQLLAFSRKQVMAPVPLDLNRQIARLSEALPRLIGEDIELRIGADERLWIVKTDPAQIDQILLNLVVNARDAMPSGGKLTIETANVRLGESFCRQHAGATPGDYVLLAVSDNGIGMDKETLSQVFEPFFTTKEKGKGTGLGLATVYGIVKQNDGYVSVHSEPGEGTTFKLYLPRTPDAATAQTEAPERAEPVGSGTILVVEDEGSVRRLTAALVESIGYTVMVAEGPAEAVRLCERREPAIDAVLTDVVMPGMSGRELHDRLKELRPGIKVVFTSGYTGNVIAHHGILEEGVQFIAKPFGVTDLARKLGEVLAGE